MAKDIDLRVFSIKKVTLIVAVVIFIVLFIVITVFLSSDQVDSSAFGGPESFANFGDYIGGVLNPFFGFMTICLLVYSIQLQLNELRISTEELRRSTKAMERQVRITRNEYERTQLVDMMEDGYRRINELFEREFYKYVFEFHSNGNRVSSTVNSFAAIRALKGGSLSAGIDSIAKDLRLAFLDGSDRSEEIFKVVSELSVEIDRVEVMTDEILKIIKSSSIKTLWVERLMHLYKKAYKNYLIDKETLAVVEQKCHARLERFQYPVSPLTE